MGKTQRERTAPRHPAQMFKNREQLESSVVGGLLQHWSQSRRTQKWAGTLLCACLCTQNIAQKAGPFCSRSTENGLAFP